LDGGGAIVGLVGVAGLVLWAREGDAAAHKASAATDIRNLSILRVLRGIPPLSVNSGMYLKFLAWREWPGPSQAEASLATTWRRDAGCQKAGVCGRQQ
jgi:hypothetical protein